MSSQPVVDGKEGQAGDVGHYVNHSAHGRQGGEQAVVGVMSSESSAVQIEGGVIMSRFSVESRLVAGPIVVEATDSAQAVIAAYRDFMSRHWQADRIEADSFMELTNHGVVFVSFVAYAYGMVVYRGMAHVQRQIVQSCSNSLAMAEAVR